MQGGPLWTGSWIIEIHMVPSMDWSTMKLLASQLAGPLTASDFANPRPLPLSHQFPDRI